jgi:hypothetical protein
VDTPAEHAHARAELVAFESDHGFRVRAARSGAYSSPNRRTASRS